ncbi:MAG: SDR family oxidoreductase, partial [candidate division WOR-3 bacterium]
VGANLVNRLVAAGESVRVLRREQSDLRLIADLPVEHAIGDVTDYGSIDRAMRGIEAVYHVAGHVSFWRKENRRMYEVNVRGTRNVVQAALKNKVRRFVHTSSTAAIGYTTDGTLADETTRYNWTEHHIGYMETKHLAELEVRRGIESGLEAVIVNPATIFGPRDVNFNAGRMIEYIQRGKLPGYPPGSMNVCDVEDVVNGHIQAMRHGRSGERYIFGGENLTFREIFKTIAEVVGAPFPDREIPLWIYFALALLQEFAASFAGKKPDLTRDLITAMRLQSCGFSSQKAIAELGYRPTPFRQTLEKAYRWYRENGYLALAS